jgi:hypothetical protein
VDEDADSRAANALEERSQPGAVRREERRIHDGRGSVLGQHAREKRGIGRVASHDGGARVAGERGDALFLHGPPVSGVVESVQKDDALAAAEQPPDDGGPEEAGPSGDEDEAHGVG